MSHQLPPPRAEHPLADLLHDLESFVEDLSPICPVDSSTARYHLAGLLTALERMEDSLSG